jgi:hypothetical protein
VILTYNTSTRRTGYAVVTVLPDATVTVSPRAGLDMPYAELVASGGSGATTVASSHR